MKRKPKPTTMDAEAALCALWALWNDKDWVRYKADYLRGHLSYAGMLETKEKPIQDALSNIGAPTDE